MKIHSLAKIGVLITNLGTPEAPTSSAVKKYLSEFLADPYVVRIPKLIWWLLLKGIILKTRPKKSAKLYQKIWTDEGSPLLVYSTKLVHKLQEMMQAGGNHLSIELAMRYGVPALKQVLLTFKAKNLDTLIVLPLYPQFSTAATASTFNEIKKILEIIHWNPKLKLIDHYATEQGYLTAIANCINSHWHQKQPGQRLLFSFHGLPKKLVNKGDPYFDQCHQTAAKVAELLQLDPQKWQVVFQSRFGRERWLKPYCIQVLKELPKNGCRHVDIICPGFAVDCLETLEEIAITNKQIFHQAGGLSYNYIPALNDSQAHVELLSSILVKNLIKKG